VTRVAIIGAGIAGLTTALELHRQGIPARVYEANPVLEAVGVGINIMPHASRLLGELGLAPQLERVSILTKESVFFNRFGQLVYREPAGLAAGYAHPQYSIHRGELQRVLLDAVCERLGADAVVLGQQVVAVRDEADGVRLHVAGAAGPGELADAVLACDGVHSVARRQLYPDEGPPRSTGITMWRGVTIGPPILSGASMVRAGWLTHGKLVHYPIRDLGDGRQLQNWLAEIEVPTGVERDWTRQGRLADFLPHYADWHFDWLDVPELFRRAELILEYPMVDQDPLPRWSFGRITLVGDAAHPMVPRGSNGAGQAILDARAVAQCLAHDPSDVPAALVEYERQRREATAQVVLTNRVNPPDAILREVYERSGDQPFDNVEDVISDAELAAMSLRYKQVAGMLPEQC
jgi:2-polyprenyl-6-methoxyphenol hydroxylase-like FAD-dependent oxidoreductase